MNPLKYRLLTAAFALGCLWASGGIQNLYAQESPGQTGNSQSDEQSARAESDNLPWRGASSPQTGGSSTSNPQQQIPATPQRFQPVPAQPLPPAGSDDPQTGPVQSGAGQRIPTVMPEEPPLYGDQQLIELASGAEPVEPQQPQLPQQDEPVPIADAALDGFTRVKKGADQLPNSAGQVWREYDISPYTYNVTGSERPQQAIVDWILKETGQDLWFNEPLGILNATRNELRVYHTPEIQQRIKQIVDRFNRGHGRLDVMGLRVITINNPSWRNTAFRTMQPIPIETPGLEGWILSKENAAILINELGRRNDFRQHSAGDVVMHDGQKYNLASKRPIQFAQSVQWFNSTVPYVQPVMSQIDEGFSLDFSSLSSLDGQYCEAIIKCEVDQVEQFRRVTIDAPTPSGQTQPLDLFIPQIVSWSVHERFRWPSDQVLLLSCGVVAMPAGSGPLDVSSLIGGARGRADALLFVEFKGIAGEGTNGVPATAHMPLPIRR